MPNLVVYVPADVSRALLARGVSEDLQRRACKEVLVGLAEGAPAGPVAKVRVVEKATGKDVTGEYVAGPAMDLAPRKCSREGRHHTNHGGRPCPECGWPGTEG